MPSEVYKCVLLDQGWLSHTEGTPVVQTDRVQKVPVLVVPVASGHSSPGRRKDGIRVDFGHGRSELVVGNNEAIFPFRGL